jgi:hypothetical protein
MTPRKRYNLAIAILGSLMATSALALVIVFVLAIEDALGPQDEVVIEAIDTTGCPRVHGRDDTGARVIVDRCK